MDEQNQTTMTQDSSNDKLMAILGYLWILTIVPILAAKDSKFAMFHANQGLWLLLADVVATALTIIVPPLGCILWIVGVVTLVYRIIGIINVSNNKMEPLPGFAALPVLVK